MLDSDDTQLHESRGRDAPPAGGDRAARQSLYAFARRTDTPYQTLVYWRRRLRGLRRSSKPKFLEVRPIARPTDPFELVLPDGRMLRIPASFDRDALAQLLAALDR